MNILRFEFRLIPVSNLLMSQKKVGRKSSPFFLKTAS